MRFIPFDPLREASFVPRLFRRFLLKVSLEMPIRLDGSLRNREILTSAIPCSET